MSVVHRKDLKIVLVAMIVIMSLFSQSFMTVSAANNTEVSLATNVKASLLDAQLATTENGQTASFTIQITNSSNQTLPLIDYWARIKGSNGKSYITKLTTDDLAKKTIPANTTGYLTYYATVEKSTTLSQLSIDLIKWDFSVSSYERVLGNLKSTSTGLTAMNADKEALLNNKKLKLKLLNYTMYEDQTYSYINFEMSITNSSSSKIDLSTLSFQSIVTNNQAYTVTPSYSALELKAYEKKNIMLSTSIPKDKWDDKMVLQILSQVSESDTSLLALANFDVKGMKNTAALTIDKVKTLQINGQELSVKAEESAVSQQEGKTYFTSKVTFENISSTDMALPSLQFYVKTFEGLLYPLQIENTEVNLLPKIKQSVTLSGQIPSADILSTSQLVYFLKGEEGSSKTFLGNFKIVLSNGNENTGNTTGTKEKTYNGLKVQQVSLQRTPNGLNDLLVAEFEVTNTSKVSKSKINTTGKFILDSVELNEDTTKIVSLDQTIVVAPGASYRFVAYTTIPYTQSIKKYGFSMSELKADNSKSYIHTFSVDNLYSAKLLAENEDYQIETVGKRGSISFKNSSLYKGNQSNLLYAELEYTNDETRSTNVTQLDGYIKNNKGDIIDITFEAYADKLLPGDTVILTTWATLPRNFSQEGLEYYFGEALSLGENETTAVVNPVYTSNVQVNEEPKTILTKLPIQQYDLSLRDVGAYLMSSTSWVPDTIELTFEYDLDLRDGSPNYTSDHTVIIEFEDLTTPKIVFSKEFTLGNLQNSEDGLTIGKGKQKSFRYTQDFIAQKTFSVYELNVYDVYKGHKKLIGNKVYNFGELK